MLKKPLIMSILALSLMSAPALSLERSCSAQLTAITPNGHEILLATITGKGQHSLANEAREEARNRAWFCLMDLVSQRYANIGKKLTSYAPTSCKDSNISGLQSIEVDIETPIRLAACTFHRGYVNYPTFYVHYQITTYGGNYCGGPEDNYADSVIVATSPIWPNNFCQVYGFDFQLPY